MARKLLPHEAVARATVIKIGIEQLTFELRHRPFDVTTLTPAARAELLAAVNRLRETLAGKAEMLSW